MKLSLFLDNSPNAFSRVLSSLIWLTHSIIRGTSSLYCILRDIVVDALWVLIDEIWELFKFSWFWIFWFWGTGWFWLLLFKITCSWGGCCSRRFGDAWVDSEIILLIFFLYLFIFFIFGFYNFFFFFCLFWKIFYFFF